MPDHRDPFVNPATPRQKLRNAILWALVMLHIVFAPTAVSDRLFGYESLRPILLATNVALFGITSAVYYRIRLDILRQNDQTPLESGETIREHDLKHWRTMVKNFIVGWCLQAGVFCFSAYMTSSLPESQLMVLIMYTPLNIVLPSLLPLVHLYIYKAEPVGQLERPFWQPPTLAAHWRRWRNRRNVDVEVAEGEVTVPLLNGSDETPISYENDEKTPISFDNDAKVALP